MKLLIFVCMQTASGAHTKCCGINATSTPAQRGVKTALGVHTKCCGSNVLVPSARPGCPMCLCSQHVLIPAKFRSTGRSPCFAAAFAGELGLAFRSAILRWMYSLLGSSCRIAPAWWISLSRTCQSRTRTGVAGTQLRKMQTLLCSFTLGIPCRVVALAVTGSCRTSI